MRNAAVNRLDVRELRRILSEPGLFQVVFDTMPLQVIVKDMRPETFGQYVIWNRRAEDWLGLRTGDVLGRTDFDFFPTEQAGRLLQKDRAVMAAREPQEVDIESVLSPARGELFLSTVRTPIFDEAGEPLGLLAVSENITERIRAELDRTHAMEMLRQLNSRIPGAIYQQTLDPAGRRVFTYVSERIEEIYGVSAAGFLGNPDVASDCILPEDRARVEAEQLKSKRDGTPFRHEYRIRRPDGEIRWVHCNGEPQRMGDTIYWHGYIMDVTERRLADEALRESEERWQLALAGSEAGVWDWKISSGELFYSDRLRDMLGYGQEGTTTGPLAHLRTIHPADRPMVLEKAIALLRRRTELFRCECRIQRGTGGYMWILAHAKAHFDEDGRPKRMIGTLIDVSERKRVEVQLREAKESAEGANRAKGDFLAMMSHEIRTPLNGVLGFAELLAGTPLEPRQCEYVQTIRDSGSNLLHVLNDILDYSKIESGRLAIESRPAIVRELLQTAVETFRARADAKKLALEVEIAPETPESVMVDALRLRQVLINLISNAVKFTIEGSIRVSVKPLGRVSDEGHIPLRFQIADSGIGIPQADLPRLFKPFEQLDLSMARRFGGTGLGLSIVQRLVEMMDGRIGATSTPGQGTTFVVDLTVPIVAPASSSAPLAMPPPPDAPVFWPASVLLVEDNAVNRRLARFMLERLGYSPDEAGDGAQAVELASRHSYEVVLMDIQMPGMDGYETARRIREHLPGAQIIALTAHAMPSDHERSAMNGMHGHITKPVRIEELRAVLARCAERAAQVAAR